MEVVKIPDYISNEGYAALPSNIIKRDFILQLPEYKYLKGCKTSWECDEMWGNDGSKQTEFWKAIQCGNVKCLWIGIQL